MAADRDFVLPAVQRDGQALAFASEDVNVASGGLRGVWDVEPPSPVKLGRRSCIALTEKETT